MLVALHPLQATEHPVERSPNSSKERRTQGSHYVGCFTEAPPLISIQEKTAGESDCNSEVRRSR